MRDGQTESYRYEDVAAAIRRMVDSGALGAGMRAPSLRRTARQQGVSMATALQAYRLLEDWGVLEARARSGFYVAANPLATRPRPARSAPPGEAQPVRVEKDVSAMLALAADAAYLPLGCAIPDAAMLAAGGLDRFLARAARVKGVQYNVYTEPRGDAGLRREIAARALRLGQALPPEDIIITLGCTEALYLALKVTTRPGDTVLIESPAYFGLLQILENLDLRVRELPTDADLGVDPDGLAEALADGAAPGGCRPAACLLSSSFNNPLGCRLPDVRKRAIIGLLADHGVPLIEDDIYGDIHFGAERPRPFASLAPEADILTCGSFSKTLAPGYRVGWICAPKGRVEALLQAKFGGTLCGPTLPQVALADFLSSGGYDNHLRRIRRAFAGTIARMTRAIDQSFPARTRVSAPEGGFVLWLELPDGADSMVLFRRAIAEHICFAPGSLFSASDRYGTCLRLSCGHSWSDRLERGVMRLGELARTMVEEEC